MIAVRRMLLLFIVMFLAMTGASCDQESDNSLLLLALLGASSSGGGGSSVETDEDAVAIDRENLSIEYASGDSASSVTQDVGLAASGENGTTITWQSSNELAVTIDGSVTRPEHGNGNITITLTATISKGIEADTKAFTITIIEQPATDAESVSEDTTNLSVDFASGDSASSVTQNVTLDTSGSNGSTITWASDDETTIATDGTVTRPANGSGDATVTLTATITKGSESDTKTFTLTVLELPVTPTLSFASTSYKFTRDVTITTVTPDSLTGTPLNDCTIAPALPSGLTLDSATCEISGTPTVAANNPTDGYTITASNDAGDGTANINIQVYLPTPANIVADTSTDYEIGLTWDAVDGANDYFVFWDTSPNSGFPANMEGPVSTNSYTLTGLMGGETYYVYIFAGNDNGGSNWLDTSEEISATVTGDPPPGIVSTVSADAGDQEVTITWSDVTGATSYNIYWDTSPAVDTSSNKIAGVTSPYMHSGLTNGSTYYYKVAAVNSGGEGELSAVVSATPAYFAPPESVSASAGDGTVTVSWASVNGADSYNIYWSTASGVSTGSTQISGVDSPYTHSGLTNGTTYYYRVVADNGAKSDLSTEVSATPAALPAGAPTVSIDNMKNKSRIQTGFIVGSASDDASVTQVEVSLDGEAWQVATGTTSWSYKLPTGSSTWRDNSAHTIRVRAKDDAGNYSEVQTIGVRKGKNKDINGDGYADLVVGQSPSSGTATLFVFHSSGASGITASSTSAASSVITGAQSNSLFGHEVTTADVNGDGYADLIASAIFYDYNLETTGRVYIFHSSGISGITQTLASDANTIITGDGPIKLGESLATGDINGDGYSDLVTSEIRDDAAPRLFVFNSSGSSGITVSSSSSASSVIVGEESGSKFGFSIATGDMNGDGYADIVAGDHRHYSNRGKVYIFHSAGSSGVTITSAASASTKLQGPSLNSWFGFSVSTGDANGDGYSDLAVGEPWRYDVDPGRAYIFHSEGSSGVSSIYTADTRIDGDEEYSRYFGWRVSLGDLNGDGYDDLIATDYKYNFNRGGAFIFHSAGSGGITLSSVNSASRTISPPSTNLEFGWALTTSDYNGDGYSDVSASSKNYEKVYVFSSTGTGGISITDPASASQEIDGASYFFFGNALW